MKILKKINSEDCFDGNFIKEYKLDEKIDFEFVEFLKNFGQIIILHELEQPFFSFDKKYFFTIKGIVDSDEIKVIYRRNNMDHTAPLFEIIIENYYHEHGIIIVKEAEQKILNKLVL